MPNVELAVELMPPVSLESPFCWASSDVARCWASGESVCLMALAVLMCVVVGEECNGEALLSSDSLMEWLDADRSLAKSTLRVGPLMGPSADEYVELFILWLRSSVL